MVKLKPTFFADVNDSTIDFLLRHSAQAGFMRFLMDRGVDVRQVLRVWAGGVSEEDNALLPIMMDDDYFHPKTPLADYLQLKFPDDYLVYRAKMLVLGE